MLEPSPAKAGDWRSTVGVFSGDEIMKRIDAAALRYREEDRKKARAGTSDGGTMAALLLGPHTVGNVGLYYVCYRLSRLGWNVMPTARNARGVDIIVYSQDATSFRTIQVKTLSKKNPVPLGSHLNNLFADFFVICRNVAKDNPECFVLTPEEVKALAHKGEKDGKISFWLQPGAYGTAQFLEKWERIGWGTAAEQVIMPALELKEEP